MNEKPITSQSVLEERARKLAHKIEKVDHRDDIIALLEFSVMGLRYAVPLSRVHAVTQISDILSIPLVPRHIPGIIRRRGESIALVNLEYFFHSDKTGISDADYAIIVTGASKRFALQVEDIAGVALLSDKDLMPPQDNFDPTQAPYASAVTIDGLIVLDLDSLVRARGFNAEKATE
jgi:chemotaxis signal transduction protein